MQNDMWQLICHNLIYEQEKQHQNGGLQHTVKDRRYPIVKDTFCSLKEHECDEYWCKRNKYSHADEGHDIPYDYLEYGSQVPKILPLFVIPTILLIRYLLPPTNPWKKLSLKNCQLFVLNIVAIIEIFITLMIRSNALTFTAPIKKQSP